MQLNNIIVFMSGDLTGLCLYITTKLVAKIEIITRGVYTMLTHINEKKKHFPLQSGYLNIGSLKSSLNNTVF